MTGRQSRGNRPLESKSEDYYYLFLRGVTKRDIRGLTVIGRTGLRGGGTGYLETRVAGARTRRTGSNVRFPTLGFRGTQLAWPLFLPAVVFLRGRKSGGLRMDGWIESRRHDVLHYSAVRVIVWGRQDIPAIWDGEEWVNLGDKQPAEPSCINHHRGHQPARTSTVGQ
ncbi:hypothetical protein LZ30DRAFT_182585 [Colletotrichum cereale]|nr:hypothetical protein LZ30DRAFT_182585 [Colletotrichum cereale]